MKKDRLVGRIEGEESGCATILIYHNGEKPWLTTIEISSFEESAKFEATIHDLYRIIGVFEKRIKWLKSRDLEWFKKIYEAEEWERQYEAKMEEEWYKMRDIKIASYPDHPDESDLYFSSVIKYHRDCFENNVRKDLGLYLE